MSQIKWKTGFLAPFATYNFPPNWEETNIKEINIKKSCVTNVSNIFHLQSNFKNIKNLNIQIINTVFTGIRARALIKIQSFFRKTGRATSHRPTGLRWCAVALAFGVMGPNSSRGPNSSKYGNERYEKTTWKLIVFWLRRNLRKRLNPWD